MIFFWGGSLWQIYACLDTQGGMPPSEARKFCIFETEIVQFSEYFLAQI